MRAIIITLFLLLHFTDSFYAGVSSPHVPQLQGTVPAWKLKLVDHLQKKYGDHNRRVAAVLAFPVFGIVGLHRIYLGTKPYVPVVYAATLGGCAGLLPLADFFAILCSKKETFETFKNNPHVFMWAK